MKRLSKAQRSALEWLGRGDDPFRRYGRSRPNCGTFSTFRVLERLGLVEYGTLGEAVLTVAGRREALREAESTSPRDPPLPPSEPRVPGPDPGPARPIRAPRSLGKRRR